jgi:hypothetical protein
MKRAAPLAFHLAILQTGPGVYVGGPFEELSRGIHILESGIQHWQVGAGGGSRTSEDQGCACGAHGQDDGGARLHD